MNLLTWTWIYQHCWRNNHPFISFLSLVLLANFFVFSFFHSMQLSNLLKAQHSLSEKITIS